ncbi:putative restriction-modification system DNA specificity domain [Actinoplanes missouriensis 431]|uniref:Putative restriction-modification system DNA specificity domain n=1 Tax=Actinoplanes missouriensis (strain ATCC 14538 / DSM 43046 / CBS 188.64 / JCM 3121 / NBRC 102363 / NCIMB 12654 / NRRL B-3342 / UNCC 431) TaxID=512565 RepID=I0HFZ1_ACTM4|nr:restriction endonuclease subunit S [Actinoplanes missouriensis]BAL91928.1 putative restriction-modification system DNA specificity domain [Actinoplanes missouriensis 431]
MSDWIERKLSDLVTIKHGYAFKGEYFGDDPKYPTLVTPGNFAVGGGFKDGKPRTYFGPEIEGFTLSAGDLVVTMTDLSKTGDTLGYPALVPEGKTYLHNQRIGLVELRSQDAIPRFLYYVLMTKRYRQHILATATGSTVRHTSPSRITEYSFKVPSLHEQHAISTTLGALDDKIAVNNRIATTAEALLRAHYEELSGNESKAKISAIGSLVKDGARPGESAQAAYIGLEHMPRKSVWINSWGSSADVTSQKNRFTHGDVLFGKLRPYFHKVGVAPLDGLCSTDILVVRPLMPEYLPWLLMSLSSDEVIAHATARSDGTRMPRTRWSDLADFEVPWAEPSTVKRFAEIARPLIEQVHHGIAESELLTQLRNTLLPDLISGLLKIENAERVIEETVQ